MFSAYSRRGTLCAVLALLLALAAHPVSFERLRALGDSLTICTQGGVISDHRNQVKSWVVLLANQMGTGMRLPLLEEMNLIGQQRRMDHPDYGTIDCYAYNGVSVDDTFMKKAEEIPWYQFGWNWNHLELILAGKAGYSMVQALEEDNPTFVVGFLGSNDFMSRVMARGTMMEGIPTLGLMDEIDPLDASRLRPQNLFYSDFKTVVSTLYKPGVGMCFGTLPMLPDIPGILDKQELTEFIGENALPEDCFTNYTVAAAVYGGLKGPEIFADDRNYYTPAELQDINNAIVGYNTTIRSLAADPAHPFAVAETPIQIPEINGGNVRVNGWRISNRIFISNLGKPRASIMTTDGVHMTDIGNAMCAQAYIRAINAYYGTSIPELSETQLTAILNNDPFVDNDGDGRIEGISCNVAFLSLNFVYGDRATNDSNESPRNAKVLHISIAPGTCGRVDTDREGPEYFEGVTVMLAADPEDPDIPFLGWEGDVPEGHEHDNPLSILMDADKSITAVFQCPNAEGEGAGDGEGEGNCEENYLIPLENDTDTDYLSNEEEIALGFNLMNPDENNNGRRDGIDLAMDYFAAIQGLPLFYAYGQPPNEVLPHGVEETLPTDAPYALRIDYGFDCLWYTAACGVGVNIGELRIVNPALHASWREGFSLPLDAFYYLEHHSFSYASNLGCQPERKGRLNIIGLRDALVTYAEGEGLPEGQEEGIAEGEGLPEGQEEGIAEGEGLPEGQEEGIAEGEGLPEGQEEGIAEGEGLPEGQEEGIAEGEGLPEGQEEGIAEGEGQTPGPHSADQDADYVIGLTELLRVIQFFNSGGFECIPPYGVSEDGYLPGPGENHACAPHNSDYGPWDWRIGLTELLRLIQFFNSGGYYPCPAENTEDGFCPGIYESLS